MNYDPLQELEQLGSIQDNRYSDRELLSKLLSGCVPVLQPLEDLEVIPYQDGGPGGSQAFRDMNKDILK